MNNCSKVEVKITLLIQISIRSDASSEWLPKPAFHVFRSHWRAGLIAWLSSHKPMVISAMMTKFTFTRSGFVKTSDVWQEDRLSKRHVDYFVITSRLQSGMGNCKSEAYSISDMAWNWIARVNSLLIGAPWNVDLQPLTLKDQGWAGESKCGFSSRGVRSSLRRLFTKLCNIYNFSIDQGLHARKPSQASLSLSALPRYSYWWSLPCGELCSVGGLTYLASKMWRFAWSVHINTWPLGVERGRWFAKIDGPTALLGAWLRVRHPELSRWGDRLTFRTCRQSTLYVRTFWQLISFITKTTDDTSTQWQSKGACNRSCSTYEGLTHPTSSFARKILDFAK